MHSKIKNYIVMLLHGAASLFDFLSKFLFHVAQTPGCVCLLLSSLLLFLHHLIHGRSKCIPDTSHLKNVKTFLAKKRSRSFFLALPIFSASFLSFSSNSSISSTCATYTNRHQWQAVLGAQRPLETTHSRSTHWSLRRYLDLRRQ